MTPTWEGEGGRGLEICYVCPDSIVFKQQIYCSFLRTVLVAGVRRGRRGRQKNGHFL